jgi:methylenetetrahydrofolate dehydrogenase (NADP+)/methenyltetrahydrofolate cyclohydrolase
MKLIRSVVPDLTGAHAVVIGSSNIVGKPVAGLLLAARATVTQTHIHTRDTQFICRGADILVSAVGKPELVRGDWIKPRAVVIDVGTTRVPQSGGKDRIVGDVCFDEAVSVAGAITPVPGGVGPMTIACLMENTVTAAKARIGCTRLLELSQTMAAL